MNVTKEQAYEKIARLVERFSEHVEEYKRNGYNEHQTRVDYINPFFKALGWDMDNEQGYAEAYREVIHEDKVKIGSSTKAPDYGFTLFGQRKFFVDAKKPAINIKGDIAPAYQVRRYGWSAKVPISIVTDFEEFSIYECTKKPKPTDKASVARIKYITYDQYLDEFDFLWDVFAKENLPKGRFDKYVQSDTRRKGTASVDDEFLKSIEEWRKYLATTIALRNKSLSEDEINYAVQKNIDRIIFLRICEDRGIEHYGDLKNAIKKGVFYQNLFKLYYIADEKYNSGLFDFTEDTITPLLTVDNKVVKNIISNLYYPVSPYEFSVLPADILGSVYERFLGKTIRLTKVHHAKIEEKPEVRKAGGVYYTPKYIVDYIVENTVGKLIKDKKPKDIEKIKIVDPACGSGSFLIGAYQYLLNWHLQYYTKNPPQKKKDNPLTPDCNLTTAEKKRILLNNIYGVDIDAQAVEVTKLNLLLKALEGETNASISKQLTFFNERVLPNLENNIKCGNSLIGTDFYDNQLVLFPGQIKKINAFDWDKAFLEIFKNGGFDVVIGNPPWGAEFSKPEKNYVVNNYPQVPTKTKDSYLYFIIKVFSILKKSGYLGFIVPNTWLLINNAEIFREYILRFKINEIIDYGDGVFKDVTAESLTLILQNSLEDKTKTKVKIIRNQKVEFENITDKSVWLKDNLKRIILQNTEATSRLLEKIVNISTLFQENCEIIWGIKPYQVGYGYPTQTKEMLKKRIYHSKTKEGDEWKPLLVGSNVNNYIITFNNDQYIKYGKNLMYPSNQQKMLNPKILLRQTSDRLKACYDDKKYYCQNSVFIITSETFNLKFLLGLLNSRFFDFLYKFKNPQKKKVFAEIKPSVIKELPIKSINTNNIEEKRIHDTIIQLVDNLLNLNKELQSTKLDTQRQQLQRAIDHAENKIDELVYELYGLTEEEIGIVENG